MVPGAGLEFRPEADVLGAARGGLSVEGGDVGGDPCRVAWGQGVQRGAIRGQALPLSVP
jgi:hypothetical protein